MQKGEQEPKMSVWTRLFCLLFGMVLLTSGLSINLIQLVLYVLLKPVNGFLYNKINYYLSYSLYSQLVFLQQYWAKVQIGLHLQRGIFDKYCGSEHAIVLMNHTYEIDWMLGWILCDACGILGNVKTIGKKSLQYLPALGFSWKLGGSIFIERDWKKDQKLIEGKLGDMVAYDDPIWLLVTAEGTRFTKEKHEASVIFARERGLPELRYHLTPRTKGFTTAMSMLRSRVSAVYNVNIAVSPNCAKPSLTNLLLGKQIVADCYVERYAVEDLPEDQESLAGWLYDVYKKKDDLLHSYFTTGRWCPEADYESRTMRPKLAPAVNFGVLSVCVLVPWGYFFLGLLASGSLSSFLVALLLIGSFVLVLKKLVDETKITNASGYGLKKSE